MLQNELDNVISFGRERMLGYVAPPGGAQFSHRAIIVQPSGREVKGGWSEARGALSIKVYIPTSWGYLLNK